MSSSDSADGGVSPFLLLILGMTCLNLLSSNLLNNSIRSNMAYWFSFLQLDRSYAYGMGSLASNLNLATILLGTASGYIVDLVSPPVMLVLMSIVSACGSLLFMLCVLKRGAYPIYVTAMIVYGGAMTLSRVPMQKIAAVLFEGPFITTAMAVNHSFSHVASILSNWLSSWFTPIYGPTYTLVIYCLVGCFTLPICLVLYGQYTKKMSVKGGSKPGNFFEMFKKYMATTNLLYWVIFAAGALIDAHTILIKNMEGTLMSQLGFIQSTANSISSSGKYVLLATPLFAMIVDMFPYREWYIVLGALNKIWLSIFMITQEGADPTAFWWYIFKPLDSAINSMFYSSFYSFFGIYLPKEIKGVGMGVNQTILAVTPFVGPMLMKSWSMKVQLYFFLILSIASLGLGLLVVLLNYKNDNMINNGGKKEEAKKSK